MKVRKAIVLAAGLGTRLRPFTCVTPKPLLPVWGEPILSRTIACLRQWGVEDIVVNCHYLHEQVEAWCKEHGCRTSYEPEILGTGGVLNPLREWIGGEDFYLVNGDIVFGGLNGNPFSGERLDAASETIAEALVTEAGPRTIEIEPASNLVTNWKSDDAGYPGTFTYTGIALLKPEILEFVEPTGFSSIVAAYEKAMMSGKFVRALSPSELLWTDAGSIANLIELNRDGDDNAFQDFPQLAATGLKGKFEFLSARGSERVFFRNGDAVIVLYDDTTRKENALYAPAAKYLAAHGIPVPEVRQDLPAAKTLVLENAGSERKMTLEEYVKVVEALARFNALGKSPDLLSLELMPAFDAATWRWERELFAEHCLGTRFKRAMSETVRDELERVAAALEKEPVALVHRDFQSTNILWKNGRLSFIDFQGMRLGPAAYDLASLIYDPYVTFTEGERRALVKLYAQELKRLGGDGEEIVKILPFAAVERLIQCLGAYGRLASVGQPQFGKFVLPALVNLLDAADLAGLEAVGALAEDLIAAERRAQDPHGGHQCHGHGHE